MTTTAKRPSNTYLVVGGLPPRLYSSFDVIEVSIECSSTVMIMMMMVDCGIWDYQCEVRNVEGNIKLGNVIYMYNRITLIIFEYSILTRPYYIILCIGIYSFKNLPKSPNIFKELNFGCKRDANIE